MVIRLIDNKFAGLKRAIPHALFIGAGLPSIPEFLPRKMRMGMEAQRTRSPIRSSSLDAFFQFSGERYQCQAELALRLQGALTSPPIRGPKMGPKLRETATKYINKRIEMIENARTGNVV